MIELSKPDIRRLRSEAQRLKAILKVGKHGLSAEFLQALDDALTHHGLVKVKFDEFKEQRHDLAPLLAEKSGSRLITMVGHVVVLFRPKPEEGESPRRELLPAP